LIQRAIEQAGIPTVALANLRPRLERIQVPRAVLTRFPRGATVGPPNQPDVQRKVLRDALALLSEASAPGTLVDLPYRWEGA
jgi:D-proline reductase (dithiol) PrdB